MGVVYSRFSLSKHQHEIDSRDCSPCGCCPLGASTKAEPWYGWGYGWPHYGGYGYAYGKRSADAESAPNADAKAEPWYGWGYGWPHYGGYGYAYGKRSADAEPAPSADAKAEPWYGWG